MSIKIGERTLATRKPADLDAALLASCGCSAAEVAAQLRGHPLAHHVARAVHPFVADKDGAPDVHELATLIAGAGIGAVVPDVLKLYGADALAADAPPASGAES